MLQSVLGALSGDMALDLGTSTTRILVDGRDDVFSEPSVVAIHEPAHGDRHILAVGRSAREMIGRTPGDIRVVRPLRDGEIADYEVAEAMLRQLMVRVQGRRLWVGPRVAVCLPYGTTEVEKRAAREAVEAAGVRQVHLVERPLAAALGVQLPIEEARGHMIVDVGGGTTEVSVLSLGGVVYSRVLRVGGEQVDAAIVHHLETQHRLLIGPRTAERVKLQMGRALPGGPDLELEVKGRDLDSGFPASRRLVAAEVQEAVAEPVRLIIEAVISSLEHTPPDVASDIADLGIVLLGDGGKLRDLDRAIGDATGLPVIAPEGGGDAAVRGAIDAMHLPVALAAAG